MGCSQNINSSLNCCGALNVVEADKDLKKRGTSILKEDDHVFVKAVKQLQVKERVETLG